MINGQKNKPQGYKIKGFRMNRGCLTQMPVVPEMLGRLQTLWRLQWLEKGKESLTDRRHWLNEQHRLCNLFSKGWLGVKWRTDAAQKSSSWVGGWNVQKLHRSKQRRSNMQGLVRHLRRDRVAQTASERRRRLCGLPEHISQASKHSAVSLQTASIYFVIDWICWRLKWVASFCPHFSPKWS